MRNNFSVVILMFTLMCGFMPSSYGAEEPTIEEQALLKAFGGFNVALAYNEVCNKADPKEMYNTKNPVSITLLGNQNILAAKFGGTQHVRFPEKTVEELVLKLRNLMDEIKAGAKGKLNKLGCESEEGKDAAKAWKFYSTINPWQLSGFLDEKIVARGGRVTSTDEIEAAGKEVGESEE